MSSTAQQHHHQSFPKIEKKKKTGHTHRVLKKYIFLKKKTQIIKPLKK
jgi:hypothetical protein